MRDNLLRLNAWRLVTFAASLVGAMGACASPTQKQAWEPEVASAPRTVTFRALDLGKRLASDLPVQAHASPAPSAREYPPPPEGRLLASFAGTASLVEVADISLPPELWLAAVPSEAARILGDELTSMETFVDSAGELDVDGDGQRELVVLMRPLELFEQEGQVRFAMLLVLAREGAKYRLRSSASFVPIRHSAPTGPPRWCHAEYSLAGALRRGKREVPVVYEERGVNCAQLVGGGFDRVLHVMENTPAPIPEIIVGRARLRHGGAADLYDGVAFAADLDGDDSEELLTRGVAIGSRPCGYTLDSPYFIEELAWRAFTTTGEAYAFRDGASTTLPGGVLPPELLASHPSSCGLSATVR